MNVQCSGGLKFCKGNESLEDEEHSGQPSDGDNDQLRALSNLIPLKLHERLPRNSTLAILWSFGMWNKLERWKSSVWVPQELTENLKDRHFEGSPSLILRNNNDWVTRAFALWWSAARLIQYNFLNPSKTITEKYAWRVDEMPWKLQHLQQALVTKGPILLCNDTRLHVAQPLLEKLNESGHAVLPHLTYSPTLKLHWKSLSGVLLCDPWTVQSMEFSRPEYWGGIFSRGIFPTQGLKPGPLQCRQILSQLSYLEAIFTWPLANRLPLLQAP